MTDRLTKQTRRTGQRGWTEQGTRPTWPIQTVRIGRANRREAEQTHKQTPDVLYDSEDTETLNMW